MSHMNQFRKTNKNLKQQDEDQYCSNKENNNTINSGDTSRNAIIKLRRQYTQQIKDIRQQYQAKINAVLIEFEKQKEKSKKHHDQEIKEKDQYIRLLQETIQIGKNQKNLEESAQIQRLNDQLTSLKLLMKEKQKQSKVHNQIKSQESQGQIVTKGYEFDIKIQHHFALTNRLYLGSSNNPIVSIDKPLLSNQDSRSLSQLNKQKQYKNHQLQPIKKPIYSREMHYRRETMRRA